MHLFSLFSNFFPSPTPIGVTVSKWQTRGRESKNNKMKGLNEN
jgi:hypothetical protein